MADSILAGSIHLALARMQYMLGCNLGLHALKALTA
jgi:hypothetical protein